MINIAVYNTLSSSNYYSIVLIALVCLQAWSSWLMRGPSQVACAYNCFGISGEFSNQRCLSIHSTDCANIYHIVVNHILCLIFLRPSNSFQWYTLHSFSVYWLLNKEYRLVYSVGCILYGTSYVVEYYRMLVAYFRLAPPRGLWQITCFPAIWGKNCQLLNNLFLSISTKQIMSYSI